MKKLSRKQMKFITDMFSGELSEEELLKEYKITSQVFNNWLNNPLFLDEFDRRCEFAARQAQALISRHKVFAAAKLVELTQCKKEETARKACLDIVEFEVIQNEQAERPENSNPENPGNLMPPEKASQLLKSLADAKDRQDE
jgi:hypothetical protein